MKNTCKYILVLAFAVVFLFYRVDPVLAMETGQNIESSDGPEAEETVVPELEPKQPAEEIPEAAGEPEPEQPAEEIPESAGEPEPEQPAEEIPESADEPELKQPAEEIPEAIGEPEPEQPTEGIAEPEPIVELSIMPGAETISTGEALMEWLESHKSVGGTVRLTDHVVLDGAYSFCPNGINNPAVFVDTGEYTITVTGEISFLSDGKLTFTGEPDGKGIFYVAENGILSICGISVESKRCALWQEEGAGLEVSDCAISGSIHYADMPFVMSYKDSLCAVVEKGQTLNDALPSQISCTVNRQGRLSHNERVPVLWNQEGTEKQQEERRRFELQGSFLDAAAAKPICCAVVYNDYPLTFTDVKASVSGDRYTFQGGFTVPEESLPFEVMTEYSFDGENWVLYEMQTASNVDAGFRIDCKWEPRGRAACSNIYIRLQWNNNGTIYFSNVLCYSADDLENLEDIGGSRGGGTSIINPPKEPQQSVGAVNTSVKEQDDDTHSENRDENANQATTGGESSNMESPKADAVQEAGAKPQDIKPEADAVQEVSAEPKAAKIKVEADVVKETGVESQDIMAKADAVQEVGAEPKNTKAAVQTDKAEQSLYAESKGHNPILMAAGFVMLSGIGTAAGFCVHSRLGTKR